MSYVKASKDLPYLTDAEVAQKAHEYGFGDEARGELGGDGRFEEKATAKHESTTVR